MPRCLVAEYSTQDMREIAEAMEVQAVHLWISNRIVDLHMDIEDGVAEQEYREKIGACKELRNLLNLPRSFRSQLQKK